MPELAEVEFYRKRWHFAACGDVIRRVRVHPQARVFSRPARVVRLRRDLRGLRFESSSAAAKQMCFRFGSDGWLGVHLGMSGELHVAVADYRPGRHDHLVLYTKRRALVFSDPRMFGGVEWRVGNEPPLWWSRIAPAILSPEFTHNAVETFLCRRGRAPIKAVLLMQERFPGIGNWMADEVLWRANIHPARLAGDLSSQETRTVWRECRRVCRMALCAIAGRGDALPTDLNVGIPRSWLFWHRWEDGGQCPRSGVLLRREVIGGRTTCWSPARQRLRQRR